MKLRTRYSLEKYDLLKAECEIRREQQNLTSVLNCYSHSQKFDFHTDLSFAVMACVDICMKIYIPRKQKSRSERVCPQMLSLVMFC